MSSVCRVCRRAADERLKLSLLNKGLSETYEKLTDHRYHVDDGRPVLVCQFCARTLWRSFALSVIACKSEMIYNQLLSDGLQINSETIDEKIDANVSISPIKLTDSTQHQIGDALIFFEQEAISDTEDIEPMVHEEPTEPIPTRSEEPLALNEEPAPFEGEKNVHIPYYNLRSSRPNSRISLYQEPADDDDDEEPAPDRSFRLSPSTRSSRPNSANTRRYSAIGSPYFFSDSNYSVLSSGPDNETDESDNESNPIQSQQQEVSAYLCIICDRVFETKLRFDGHLSRHFISLRACPNCNKQFLRQAELTRHKKVHTGETPYVCEICDRNLKKKTQVKSHMIIHDGPYSCAFCEKTYRLRNHLKLHSLTHCRQTRSMVRQMT